MALIPEQLFDAEVPQSGAKRAYPREDGIIRGTLIQFGAAADLPHLTPLYFKDASSGYDVWLGQSNEVNTITSNATPATAGTFTLTIEGEVSGAIAFDADAAAVQAAIEAMTAFAPGDVVAVDSGGGTDLGDASHVVTLTWGGAYAGQDITITIQTGGLTGNAHALATSTAGGSDAGDGSKIDAFLWSPEADHAVSTVGTQVVNVFVRGLIHSADVPVPSGE